MNVHISYKAAKAPDLEKEFQHHIAKIEKRLQVFRPELVHLHAIVEQNSTREGVVVALNLRLPSGQMAVQKSGPTAIAAIKAAFADLLSQLSRHKDLLRTQHRRRLLRRSVREQQLPGVPFEQTPAAVHPPTISESDIRSWVNANLARLKDFVDRELRFREANGLLTPNLVSPDEVIDEVIASALGDGDGEERPELLSLERWLYRLAIRAIARLASGNREAVTSVPLDQSARKQNVLASNEPQLQYHQPDEMLTEMDVIADPRIATPEQTAATVEMVNLIESALRGVRPEDREAFILYAIEGFSIREIVMTTDRSSEDVRRSIEAGRQRVLNAVPATDLLKRKLLEYTAQRV